MNVDNMQNIGGNSGFPTFSADYQCLNPPQKDIPDDAFLCQYCASAPLPAKVAKIISWRWHEAPYTEVDDDRPGKEGQKTRL